MARGEITTSKNYLIKRDHHSESRMKKPRIEAIREGLIDMEDKGNLSIIDVLEEENLKM